MPGWLKLKLSEKQRNRSEFCIDPTDDKLLAIKNAPIPSNITQLQSYSGMSNFYRHLVKDVSSLLETFNKLLHQDSKCKIWVLNRKLHLKLF